MYCYSMDDGEGESSIGTFSSITSVHMPTTPPICTLTVKGVSTCCTLKSCRMLFSPEQACGYSSCAAQCACTRRRAYCVHVCVEGLLRCLLSLLFAQALGDGGFSFGLSTHSPTNTPIHPIIQSFSQPSVNPRTSSSTGTGRTSLGSTVRV